MNPLAWGIHLATKYIRDEEQARWIPLTEDEDSQAILDSSPRMRMQLNKNPYKFDQSPLTIAKFVDAIVSAYLFEKRSIPDTLVLEGATKINGIWHPEIENVKD